MDTRNQWVPEKGKVMPNLDELSHDMSFTIGGETFIVHDVSPDVLLTMEEGDEEEPAEGEADDGSGTMKRIDDQILMFLNGDEDSVRRWKALRGRTENIVPLWKLLEFRRLLWETQSARPTNPPAPSVAGRGRIAPTSEAA